MKQIASICLGALIGIAPVTVLTNSAAAQTRTIENQQHSSLELAYRGDGNEITAYDLVSQAYQGRFEREGIPSAAGFISGVRANRITATRLIEVGVAMGRLSESQLGNESYRRAVKNILDNTINTN